MTLHEWRYVNDVHEWRYVNDVTWMTLRYMLFECGLREVKARKEKKNEGRKTYGIRDGKEIKGEVR